MVRLAIHGGLVATAAVTGGCIDWESLSPPGLTCPSGFRERHATGFDTQPPWAPLFGFSGAVASIDAGQLAVDLAPDAAGDAYAGVETPLFDARNGVFRTRIIDVPATANGETSLSLSLPDRTRFVGLSFQLDAGILTALRDDNGDTQMQHDEHDALWLQLVTSTTSVSFQVSSDGSSWRELATTPTPAFLANATVSLQAGTWAAVSAPGRASFDFLLECEPSS